MNLKGVAEWLRSIPKEHAPEALIELAQAVELYRPQTHVETYALTEVAELARERLNTELAARGFA